MITVGIDTTPLTNLNAFRGVGYYTQNLVENLKTGKEKVKVISGQWRDFWPTVDLIHFPYFDLFFNTLPFSKKRPTVVTIHDCIPLVLAKFYPVGIRGKLNLIKQKVSLAGVKAIITDSQSSQKDIVKYLKVPPEKVSVVYLAASKIFKPIRSSTVLRRIMVKYGLPESFVLYVGDVNYNKNIPCLIDALAALSEKKISLVLVGKAFENEELPEVKQIKEKVAKMNLAERVKFLGYVPMEDLVAIYNLASVYCQPSLYEGFGLQILEAMACGVPVITANVSSLPEVAGNAAVLVDPNDSKQLALNLQTVINDLTLRKKMIKLGFAQVKKFSWERTAQETLKIYEKILAS